MILEKPHQQKGSLLSREKGRTMVVPFILSASTCTKCWCLACLFAKAKKNSIDSSFLYDPVEVEGALTNKEAQPGNKISCDQYMSSTKERLIHTRGKESSMKQLCGGKIC